MVIIISKKDNKIIVSFVDEPASEDVTGSMVYIKTPNYNILLDCGLSQSNDRVIDHAVNNRKFKEVKSKDVDFVIISHLHADHSLLAPKLYVDGCRGSVHAVRDTFKFSERYEEIIKEYILKHTTIDEKMYKEIERQEFWMTAEDMKKYGIVDEIV